MKTIYTKTKNYSLKLSLIVLFALAISSIFSSCTADEIETNKQENATIEIHETFLQRKDSTANKEGDVEPIIITPPIKK
jgi:hypothetical protein